MRNLYFKIFMWFWLAMALVGTAFVISTVTLQNSQENARQRAFITSGLALTAQGAIEAYEQGGREELAQHLARVDRRGNLRAYLFDADATELSGREVPDNGPMLVAAAIADDELAVEELEDSRRFALTIEGASGASYVILAEMDWPFRGASRGGRGRFEGSPGRGSEGDGSRGPDFRGGRRGDTRPWYAVWTSVFNQPAALMVRLLVVFLTAGVLCYGLARYLTAPVLRLRDATHRLAGGDLSVRVGPDVAKRGDEIAELGRDFDIMAERVEALLTSQRQLLSDVSHELRSPLARLNVALGLARQRAGDEAAGPLDRIESEADQLNALIGRVLALSRFESGAMEPEFMPLDLARLVADVAADADFEAEAKAASVAFTGDGPCRLEADEPLLRSAIENVIRNAVRYTDPGSTVDVTMEKNADADGVVVRVRDHGPGVPEDQLDDLFEPFYRIADSRDRESGGTGLGLSIAQRAVRLHGGTIRARNAEDGGLVIEIVLPRADRG